MITEEEVDGEVVLMMDRLDDTEFPIDNFQIYANEEEDDWRRAWRKGFVAGLQHADR